MVEECGQEQQRLDVVRLARQDPVHTLARLVVFLGQQQKGGKLQLGLGVGGVQLRHRGVSPEGLLGLAQLQARLGQQQVGRGELRVDLDGVFEFDLGRLELALVEVFLALGEMRLLLVLLGRAPGESQKYDQTNPHQQRRTSHS